MRLPETDRPARYTYLRLVVWQVDMSVPNNHSPSSAEIAARHLELNDIVTEYLTDNGTVYACQESVCQRIGLSAHAHSQRLYLCWSNPDIIAHPRFR